MKEKEKMEIVKMFNSIEIQKETGINVLDIYNDNFCNDVAIPWWIGNIEYDEDYKKIDNYLLAHGANPNEKVWIDVTW